MPTCNRPVPFVGTAEERAANYATHNWCTWDEETECMECCSKPWHAAASYPCGQEPPREIIEIKPGDDPTGGSFTRFATYAAVEALLADHFEGV